MKEVILVKTTWCPHCPAASKFWRDLQKKYKFNLKEIDASTPEGQKLVQKYNILSVPTTIIDGRLTFIGVPAIEQVEQAIK